MIALDEIEVLREQIKHLLSENSSLSARLSVSQATLHALVNKLNTQDLEAEKPKE